MRVKVPRYPIMADEKVNLSRQYTYRGESYGPGETEIPENVRNADDLSPTFKADIEGEDGEAEGEDSDQPSGGPIEPGAPVIEGDDLDTLNIPEEFKNDLRQAGYSRKEDLSRASDEELDDVPGVGPARITQLRQALADDPTTPASQ